MAQDGKTLLRNASFLRIATGSQENNPGTCVSRAECSVKFFIVNGWPRFEVQEQSLRVRGWCAFSLNSQLLRKGFGRGPHPWRYLKCGCPTLRGFRRVGISRPSLVLGYCISLSKGGNIGLKQLNAPPLWKILVKPPNDLVFA